MGLHFNYSTGEIVFGTGFATISTPDGVNSDGTNLSVSAGDGDPFDGSTASTGGSIDMTAGHSSAREDGGSIMFTAGNLFNNTTGVKVVTVSAGNVTLVGGALSGSGNHNEPGGVNLIGGANTQTNGTGGGVFLLSGAGGSPDGSGGEITLEAEQAFSGGAGSGGIVEILGGGAYSGFGGYISLLGGGVTTGTAGGTQAFGGPATTAPGIGGTIKLYGGEGKVNGTTPGNVFLATFGGSVTTSSGDFTNTAQNPPNIVDDENAVSRQYVLRQITANNAATEIFLDYLAGLQRKLVLANNSAWKWEVHIIAHRTDAVAENAAFQYAGAIKRDANAASTALVGTVQTIMTPQAVGLSVTITITADTTNGSLKIEVTGETGKTIRWVAYVRSVETKN